MMATTLGAVAQNPAPPAHTHNLSADIGVTYSAEYGRIVQQNCACFWLQGAGGDVSVNFYHGLGLAGAVTFGTTNNIQPGVNLSKITYAASPRYTWVIARPNSAKPVGRIFGQALFGEAYGYNSVFPSATGTITAANSTSI
jgi:hypothetical protein